MKGVRDAAWAALAAVLGTLAVLVYCDLRPLLVQYTEVARQTAAVGYVVQEKLRPIDLRPIMTDVTKTTQSVATAAGKWEKASDEQIKDVTKTGRDTRLLIAHMDRAFTNQIVPMLENLNAASDEVPQAVRSITLTADAATTALNATKVPMDDLHSLLSDREKGMPALLDESAGTMAEMHSAAGNFETFSERWTHPASALKQWFFGLLDVVFKAKSLSK